MRFLGIIRHNAERLARLTEDLLTLSRVEQKRQKFEFEPHSSTGCCGRPSSWCGPSPKRADPHVDLERAPADAEVWCDSEAVSQMLSNLLDNAIKYTPAGGRITVGARPAGRFVEVYVRDTGAGIPAEDLPRLFERFYRVERRARANSAAPGLGLSIVKHLVAAHNGTVRVESRVRKARLFFSPCPPKKPRCPRKRRFKRGYRFLTGRPLGPGSERASEPLAVSERFVARYRSRRGGRAPMKIVVLDGYCLNPGDLSWDAVRAFGETAVFDRTPAGQAVRARRAPRSHSQIRRHCRRKRCFNCRTCATSECWPPGTTSWTLRRRGGRESW